MQKSGLTLDCLTLNEERSSSKSPFSITLYVIGDIHMLDFRRMKIQGDIESNVKNKLLQKSIFINFQAQNILPQSNQITLQKVLQRPTIYQIN